jgi:saccharopine dehydrogenase-like NADP-dependent oxidoreductase
MSSAPPFRVAIVGSGHVGIALARMLTDAGDYEVALADCTEEARANAARHGLGASHVDAARGDELARFIVDADVVVAAVPDQTTLRVANAAIAAGIHYLDFSESGEAMGALARRVPPGRAFLTGCGVSPGLVGDLARGLAASFPGEIDLSVCVGAIPARRLNRLGYGMIWNVDGLIGEYTEPCDAIVDGRRTRLEPLAGEEAFEIEGVRYEAFRTAGGMGGLIESLEGKARNLVFRTIRYPGHLDHMRFLLDDLGLARRPDLLRTVLANGLPPVAEDVVLITLTARGMRDGRMAEASVVHRISMSDAPPLAGMSALALGSAAHAAALLDRLREGGGLEARPHDALLANRFLAPIVTSHLP